ncbi:MAG: CD1871A family CXXC motif-containing protein [Eubacteriales bacterium]|nr:CD1871A family CXXC motif-containing protein [Eubacteriales bacterium]
MNGIKKTTIQVSLIGAGAAMIVLGMMSDELIVILHKAIYICLECIGIG